MLTSVQECACKALDTRNPSRHLVIIASAEDAKQVRGIVGSSIPPDSRCVGHSWVLPSGERISIFPFSEKPIRGAFDLCICNGGRELSTKEREEITKWEAAANG